MLILATAVEPITYLVISKTQILGATSGTGTGQMITCSIETERNLLGGTLAIYAPTRVGPGWIMQRRGESPSLRVNSTEDSRS